MFRIHLSIKKQPQKQKCFCGFIIHTFIPDKLRMYLCILLYCMEISIFRLFSLFFVVSFDTQSDQLNSSSHILLIQNICNTHFILTKTRCSIEALCRCKHNSFSVIFKFGQKEHQEIFYIINRKFRSSVESSARFLAYNARNLHQLFVSSHLFCRSIQPLLRHSRKQAV